MNFFVPAVLLFFAIGLVVAQLGIRRQATRVLLEFQNKPYEKLVRFCLETGILELRKTQYESAKNEYFLSFRAKRLRFSSFSLGTAFGSVLHNLEKDGKIYLQDSGVVISCRIITDNLLTSFDRQIALQVSRWSKKSQKQFLDGVSKLHPEIAQEIEFQLGLITAVAEEHPQKQDFQNQCDEVVTWYRPLFGRKIKNIVAQSAEER